MLATLGLDIGGANLKAAHSGGLAKSQAFNLWKQPAALPGALRGLLSAFPNFDLLAVTMTGELCDCFETKRHGVHAILEAVEAVAGSKPIRVWNTAGRLVDVPTARTSHLQVAAANWHALATFAGRFAPTGPAILIDMGSTTTDIIPLLHGTPTPQGLTDPDRLHSKELIYIGVRRTPICALLGAEVAAEWFATTHDAFLVLGHLEEDSEDKNSTDGRPATRMHALARLARMICADTEIFSEEETQQLARSVDAKVRELLLTGVEQVAARLPGPPETIVTSGSGEFVLLRTIKKLRHRTRVISLSEGLGPEISSAACAYALAVLAQEQ